MAGIWELWIVYKSLCDGIMQKTGDQLYESKIYHDSRIFATEKYTSIEEYDIVSTSSEDCCDIEDKIKSYIDGLIKVTNLYPNIPIIKCLNINMLQNKIINLRETIAKAPLDVFFVHDTKVDDSFVFLNSQFALENVPFSPFSKYWDSKAGGKTRIISKRLEILETKTCEFICIELYPGKKWCVLFAYIPQNKIKLYLLKKYQDS